MSKPIDPKEFDLATAKAEAFIHRSIDAAKYIGPIKMDNIQKTFEDAFERLAFENGKKLSFEDFIATCENLDTIVATAHPTFFKSKEEAGHLAKLFTARAEGKVERVKELEAQVRDIQTRHPYQDPTTDEEGERLYDALGNTISPGQMMQRAMINVAKKQYPDQWQKGHYSPFNRTIWQKFDRDGRVIPVNVQLGEALRQRRMGLERIYLPQFRELLGHNLTDDQRQGIQQAIEKMETTARIYKRQENNLAALDEESIDMDALQEIVDYLQATKDQRITHPKQVTSALTGILSEKSNEELFIAAKCLNDDLESNGLNFATPTHRVNADDLHSYLNFERRKVGKGDLRNKDTIDADEAHFASTEQMIAEASDEVKGTFTDTLKEIPQDGKPVHEMMLIRRLVNDCIDEHTIEKVDVAEAHNAMTQRGLRLAAKKYGVSGVIDAGLLHEDNLGIDNANRIYATLLKSKQYIEEISHTVPGTTKKRPRIVMKIGYSDFAKQHSSPGGKPYNEKCLLQTIKAIKDAGLAGQVDLDIEFAGGEGPGRRVNPKGYEWTLKETITPAVLSYAAKHGVAIKYRETIQGGDGATLLGTEQSAAKVMATQLDHLSKHTSESPENTKDREYYNSLRGKVREHHQTARDAYHALYNNPDFALLMKLHKEMCIKGGSRKVSRTDGASPYDKDQEYKAPLADFRAIGFNAAAISTGMQITTYFGQGTAFFESMDRTEELMQSKLFRERMMTSIMVNDMHMIEELKAFAELYNPEYWRQFPRYSEDGKKTTETQIAHDLSTLVYSDDKSRRIYPRLREAVRLIEDDFMDFNEVRKRFNLDDVEAIIANENASIVGAGDYAGQLKEKRELASALHQNRIKLLHDAFIRRAKMPKDSTFYTEEAREKAIKAGAVLDNAVVSEIFDGAVENGQPTFADDHKEIQAHITPILDLAGNA